jgi:Tfp pilus assembly PilM family ATPase
MNILAPLREAAAPSVAVEMAADRVSAASLELRGGQPVVAAYATESLPDGALVPSLTTANIHNRAAVLGALGHVFDRIGGRPRRVGLVIPDPVAKVSLVRFEHVPARQQDLDGLIRWQVKKASPFAIEDAQVGYTAGQRAIDGQEFIVAVAKRDIVHEYEELCGEVGAHAGLVDLATFNVINAILAGRSLAHAADWLIVNVTADYASIAILRGDDLIFFRNRGSETEGTLSDLVHQTAMYYEDRLSGRGFERVLLAGIAADGRAQASDFEQARRSLAERLNTTVETVDPRAAASLTDRISAAPSLLDALAPLVGMLVREQGIKVG